MYPYPYPWPSSGASAAGVGLGVGQRSEHVPAQTAYIEAGHKSKHAVSEPPGQSTEGVVVIDTPGAGDGVGLCVGGVGLGVCHRRRRPAGATVAGGGLGVGLLTSSATAME